MAQDAADGRAEGPEVSLPSLAAALEQLSEAAEVTDRDGRILYVNPAFERLLGYRREDALGKTPAQLLRAGTRSPAFYEAIFDALLRGEPWTGVLESRRKDGSLIALEVAASPILDERGQVTHVLAFRRDITDRLRAEEAIRESEARWRTVFERNPAVKLLIDPETGRIVKANEEAAAFYGWSPSDLTKMHVQDIHAAPEEEVLAELRAAREERRKHFRFTHRLRSGERRRVEAFTGPLRFGSRTLLLSILHDVTEREAALEQLLAAEARERALLEGLHRSQRMEALGRLAAGLAHDFNELLFVVLGSTQLLRAELGGASPTAEGHVERIQRATTRAAERVHQLLLFGRGGDVPPEEVDLGKVVADVVPLLGGGPGAKVRLEISIEPGARAFVPPSAVDPILVHLVSNALEAAGPGGHVSVRTRPVDLVEPDAGALGLPPGPFVELSVTDDGPGMDEPTLDRAFEPFFTTKDPKKHLGLGLSVVYGLVRRAGGGIGARNVEGGGAELRVLLPRASASEARATARAEEAAQAESSTILVVDDQAAVRAVLERILLAGGHRVLSAASGAEALALLDREEGRVDLVLTDVQMPEMGGLELAARVQASHPRVRVSFMSGHPGDAFERGEVAADLLRKPFSGGDLLSLVARHLAQRP